MYGWRGCMSGHDEQSISEYYKDKRFHMIHQRYNFFPWHTDWLEDPSTAKIYHYFNHPKPWNMTYDERRQWPDLLNWCEMAQIVYDKHQKYLPQDINDMLVPHQN